MVNLLFNEVKMRSWLFYKMIVSLHYFFCEGVNIVFFYRSSFSMKGGFQALLSPPPPPRQSHPYSPSCHLLWQEYHKHRPSSDHDMVILNFSTTWKHEIIDFWVLSITQSQNFVIATIMDKMSIDIILLSLFCEMKYL